MSIVIPEGVQTIETAAKFEERLTTLLAARNQADKDIILSSDLEVDPFVEPSGLSRMPIHWPIQHQNMFYILEAPPNTDIPPHKHSGDVFRYIISGELFLNSMLIKAGMWVVVRKGTPYAVNSETGYTALVAYQDLCEVTGKRAD